MMARPLIIATVCASAAGCFAPGKDLPDVTYDQIRLDGPRPALTYEVAFTCGKDGQPAAEPIPPFRPRVQQVFDKSGAFLCVAENDRPGEYHLKLRLAINPDREASSLPAVNAVASGLTFFMVPLAGQDAFVLEADLVRDGQVLHQHRYQDHVDSFVWTLPGMLSGLATMVPAYNDLFDKLLMNLLRDVREDILAEHSRQAASPPLLPPVATATQPGG